ncbi:MAG: HipA domain-containing protein, partial [Acidobacteriota bacterium]
EGRELYHGNQVLAGQVLGYDPAKKFRQSSHTLANIFSALDRVFRRGETAAAAKQRIADYLVLDALVGNTDRHHENWGILVKRTPRGRTGMIAPSFDHASSLGRELLDDTPGKCRVRILKENRIEQYAEKAPGAIYWNENDKRAIGPLELVRRAAAAYPDLFRPALAGLDSLEKESVERIVGRVPQGWMSGVARQFALELTCYNLKQLKEIAL